MIKVKPEMIRRPPELKSPTIKVPRSETLRLMKGSVIKEVSSLPTVFTTELILASKMHKARY